MHKYVKYEINPYIHINSSINIKNIKNMSVSLSSRLFLMFNYLIRVRDSHIKYDVLINKGDNINENTFKDQ